MSAKRIGFVLVLLLLALLPSTSRAAGRVVSTAHSPAFDAGDCQTIVEAGSSIQAAITAAANGTVICVRDGIYYEIVVVPAAKTGLTLAQMDVIELNEAFAAQALAVSRALDLDPARVNPNGGAIALGHPVGATGAILTVKALHELERTGGKTALITMCIGGGQGIALAIERA